MLPLVPFVYVGRALAQQPTSGKYTRPWRPDSLWQGFLRQQTTTILKAFYKKTMLHHPGPDVDDKVKSSKCLLFVSSLEKTTYSTNKQTFYHDMVTIPSLHGNLTCNNSFLNPVESFHCKVCVFIPFLLCLLMDVFLFAPRLFFELQNYEECLIKIVLLSLFKCTFD